MEPKATQPVTPSRRSGARDPPARREKGPKREEVAGRVPFPARNKAKWILLFWRVLGPSQVYLTQRGTGESPRIPLTTLSWDVVQVISAWHKGFSISFLIQGSEIWRKLGVV